MQAELKSQQESEEAHEEVAFGADPLDPWDYSTKEYDLIRVELLPAYPIIPLLQLHERNPVPGGGGTWSHKCCCPNYLHKQGSERTPSFCVSDHTNRFMCFGCGWRGDYFTLLASMRAGIAYLDDLRGKEEEILSGLWRGGGHQLDLAFRVPKPDIVKLNHRLGCVLRDYLNGFRGRAEYGQECVWVDYQFKMIDEKLAKIERDDTVSGQRMYEQVLMDLERRKAGRIEGAP